MKNNLVRILIGAALLLSACAPAATPAPAQPTQAPEAPTAAPSNGGVDWENVDPTGQKIVFWHVYTKAQQDALTQIAADFNSSNQYKISVDVEYQGSYPDIFNKMLGVINTSDAPDLVIAYQNQAATYQLGQALVDMNPLVNSPKWGLSQDEQKDFFPGFFAQDVFPTFGNARLGFPTQRSMEVLYYNADWLKELGYDAPPTTPDQFKEMACKAAQQPYSKATASGSSIGYEFTVSASTLGSFTFAQGGDIFDASTGQYTYNSPAAVAAMTWLQDLFNNGCALVTAERFGDQTDFGVGKALFTVGSTAGLPFYKSAVDSGAKFNWAVAAIPHTTPDPAMNVYGPSISMPKTTSERDLAAWIFLKYFASPEVQAKWAEVTAYFPVRASVQANLKDYFDANPDYKYAFSLLPYAKFEPSTPGYDFVRQKVETAIAAITTGADVKSTLDSVNTEANQILEQQMNSLPPTPLPPTPQPSATP
jgi:multiple sugar transport system substrate-binding protein